MIKSNRIKTIVEQTKGINVLLDIGCDHGLVLKDAIDNRYIKKGIAADINEGPLKNAKKNLKGYPVSYQQSDGFKNIDKIYDGVVIAGVGAKLMIDILRYDPRIAKVYILQTNKKYDILRHYLMSNNYKIIDEIIVYKEYYYIVMIVSNGIMHLSEKEKFLGPSLIRKNSSKEYYKHQLKRYQKIVDRAKDNNKIAILQKIKWLKSMMNKKT